MTFWWRAHVTNQKSCNCFSIITETSKFGRLEDSTHQVMWLFDTWSREKSKNFYLHFSNTHCSQTWQSRGLGWETTYSESRERLTRWLRGHYLFNVFKGSVAIILKILSLLSVVLRFLDGKIILILSYLTFRSSLP